MIRWLFERYTRHPEAPMLIATIFVIVLTLTVYISIFFPIWIALMIGYLLQYLIDHLQLLFRLKHRIAHAIAFFTVLALFFFTVAELGPLFVRQVRLFYQGLPGMIDKVTEMLAKDLNDPLLSSSFSNAIRQTADALQSQHSFQKTAQATIEFIPSAIHGLIYCFIIPVMVFFSTRDRDLVKSFLWHVYPDNVPHLRKIAEAVVQQLDYYVRGKVVHMFTLGTISFLLFSSFHLNYAYMLAVPMGFSVFVPLVGGALATIPVFLTGYTQFGFGWTFLHLVIAYELMLLFESNVLEPMIFSHSNQMHPLAILTSVIILGGTIGVWGVFLAIPTAAILKVLGRLWPIYDNGTYEEWVKKCS